MTISETRDLSHLLFSSGPRISSGIKKSIWACIVFSALVEPKQVKFFFQGAQWPYPGELLLALFAIFYLATRRYIPAVPNKLLKIYFAFAMFATVYLMSSAINACLWPSLDTKQLLNGSARVILQYLITPPLVFILLHSTFKTKKSEVLRSFVLPAVIGIALFATGLFLFLSGSGAAWVVLVREEVLSQSWVPVGHWIFFVPKWGGTFAESQELGFFLLLVYLLIDVSMEQLEPEEQAHLSVRTLRVLFLCLALFTASKSVLAGALIYQVFRNHRHVGIKIAVLTALAVVGMGLTAYWVVRNPNGFIDSALAYNSFAERLFHLFYTINRFVQNPLHLCFGLGPRQYGMLVSQAYPLYFTHLTNPVSFVGVVADSGLFGLLSYLYIPATIWKMLGTYREKLAIVAAFVTNLWIPDWSLEIYVLFMLVMAFSSSEYSFNRNVLVGQSAI